MDDREEARRALDEWINSSFDMDAYNFAREYKGTAMRALARGFYAAWRIRAEARAEAFREAAERDIAGEVWDLLVEHLDPADRRRGITSIYEAMREKFPRPAMRADHTPYSGKRAEDVRLIRKVLSMDSPIWELRAALAALDRIVGKEE